MCKQCVYECNEGKMSAMCDNCPVCNSNNEEIDYVDIS